MDLAQQPGPDIMLPTVGGMADDDDAYRTVEIDNRGYVLRSAGNLFVGVTRAAAYGPDVGDPIEVRLMGVVLVRVGTATVIAPGDTLVPNRDGTVTKAPAQQLPNYLDNLVALQASNAPGTIITALLR